MTTEIGILVIRIAEDCGVCVSRKASGQIDFIRNTVTAEGYKVIVQDVASRVEGDPKGPDLFNYPSFTPYFMFMTGSTYAHVLLENPPVESVLPNIRLYNWMIVDNGEIVKAEKYERFFHDMVKFCHDSYQQLTGLPYLPPVALNTPPRRIKSTAINFRS